MITTQACYSRSEAIIGAPTVVEYKKGTVVKVVAVTDTGYYKLADGSFIHSDYLSETDAAPSSTTARPATTTAPVTASDPFPTETTRTPSANVNTDSNAKYTDRYFWSQLTTDEQTLYANIVRAAQNFDRRPLDVPAGMDYNGKMKIFFLVFNMEPQLFWLDTSASVTPTSMSLKYTLSSAEAATIQSEIDVTTQKLMRDASQYSSSFNKLLIFYNYIILNNEFLLSGTAATCGIENGLRPGTGGIQCNGYAKTLQYLCDVAGIECLTIPGLNNKEPSTTHAWNKVKISGKWYNVDATYGDPADWGGKFNSHPFFLVPDAWTRSSHLSPNTKTLSSGYTINFFTPPAANSDDLNYFRIMNREYTGAEAGFQGMCAEIKRAINAGELTAEIRMTDKAGYDTLVSDTYFKEFQKYARTLYPGVTLKRQKSDRAESQVVQYNFVY
jgi:hypothetical protein